MTREIVRNYGSCEVTLSFNESSSNAIDKVKWLLIESYAERVGLQIEDQEQKENNSTT